MWINWFKVWSSSLVTQDQTAQTACLFQIKYTIFQNLISRISAGKLSTLDGFFLSEMEGPQQKLLEVFKGKEAKSEVQSYPLSCRVFQMNM